MHRTVFRDRTTSEKESIHFFQFSLALAVQNPIFQWTTGKCINFAQPQNLAFASLICCFFLHLDLQQHVHESFNSRLECLYVCVYVCLLVCGFWNVDIYVLPLTIKMIVDWSKNSCATIIHDISFKFQFNWISQPHWLTAGLTTTIGEAGKRQAKRKIEKAQNSSDECIEQVFVSMLLPCRCRCCCCCYSQNF